MILLFLLVLLIVCAFLTVFFNNIELRKHNDELRLHNHQLFMQNHRLEWEVAFVSAELRFTEAEYGVKTNHKRRVHHGVNSLAKM